MSNQRDDDTYLLKVARFDKIAESRRVYPVAITVNDVTVARVVIDPHYEIKHRSSMSDALILDLVGRLDRGKFFPDGIDGAGYRYFVRDQWIKDKHYRLIWMFPPAVDFLGVINAYRRHCGRNK